MPNDPHCDVGCLPRALLPFSDTLKIRRPKAGEYDSHGRWTGQPVEEIEIQANVQPMGPRELLRLPENWRARGSVLVYSFEKLTMASVEQSIISDEFDWNGDTYEIGTVEDWSQFGFYKTTAIKKGR